jgi:hypothetical protein
MHVDNSKCMYIDRRERHMKVSPFHSSNPDDPDVYHDENTCPPGQLIPPHNWVSGTGGYRKCFKCREISG